MLPSRIRYSKIDYLPAVERQQMEETTYRHRWSCHKSLGEQSVVRVVEVADLNGHQPFWERYLWVTMFGYRGRLELSIDILRVNTYCYKILSIFCSLWFHQGRDLTLEPG